MKRLQQAALNAGVSAAEAAERLQAIDARHISRNWGVCLGQQERTAIQELSQLTGRVFADVADEVCKIAMATGMCVFEVAETARDAIQRFK